MRTYLRIRDGRTAEVSGEVVREQPLTVSVNGERFLTLLCSPQQLEALIVGYLWMEKVIASPAEVARLGGSLGGGRAGGASAPPRSTTRRRGGSTARRSPTPSGCSWWPRTWAGTTRWTRSRARRCCAGSRPRTACSCRRGASRPRCC